MEPINTRILEYVIQQIKAADLAKQKEVKISIDQAKQLSYTLSEVMLRLNGQLEAYLLKRHREDETVSVKLDGGQW